MKEEEVYSIESVTERPFCLRLINAQGFQWDGMVSFLSLFSLSSLSLSLFLWFFCWGSEGEEEKRERREREGERRGRERERERRRVFFLSFFLIEEFIV